MATIMAKAQASFYQGFEALFEDVLSRSNDEDVARLMKNLEVTGWIEGNLIKRQLETAIEKVLHSKAKDLIQGDYESTDLFEKVQDLHKEFKFIQYTADWELCAAEAFVRIRMEEIFDIITSFPESEPAVRELKAVLGRTTLQAEVAEAIRTALARRLNHPGADTVQIIDVYISTINTIRILDSRLSVTDAVRAYLGQRRDTVRCVLTSLITVYAELLRRPTPLEPEHEPPDMEWQPAPALHQQKVFVSNVSKEDDILAKLVSIYGTKVCTKQCFTPSQRTQRTLCRNYL
jgi:multidrug efflux pump subunit AcrA (membrane-fusion protein)